MSDFHYAQCCSVYLYYSLRETKLSPNGLFGLVGMFWKPGVTPHHSVHDCLGLKTISNIAHFRNWEALERINFTNRLDERKNHRWFQNMFSVHPKFAGK